jgi:hypothetical protein
VTMNYPMQGIWASQGWILLYISSIVAFGFCNVPPPRSRARLHLVAFLGYSQPPQTNTSLFCTLCPHSCAPGKYFPVGHPSLNCSRPSTLNFRVLWRWASEKEVATCWYESLINPIKPWAGCYT